MKGSRLDALSKSVDETIARQPAMTRRTFIVVIAAVALLAAIAGYFQSRSPSVEQLLGAPLPPSARVLSMLDRGGPFGGDYFVVIEMSHDDFRGLVQKKGLVHRADLLDYWSGALRAPVEMRLWHVSNINDADTFFGDDQDSAYLVARYEDGKMYYKVHVY